MPSTLVVDSKEFASRYLSEHEYKKSARRTREWAIPTLQHLGVSSGRVLSIGCANGVDVLEMRQHGYDARGIDLYRPCEQAGPWCLQAPASDIPFPPEDFDAAVMLEVIEHIPQKERQAVAAECLRILRPGGVLIIATPNRLFPIDEHGGKFGRWHSPFSDDTVSTRELEILFRNSARVLSWKNYFAFQVIPAARLLKPFMSLLDFSVVHRSPLNPHLFLSITKPKP
jgi:SAM-dependent methyltransferase